MMSSSLSPIVNFLQNFTFSLPEIDQKFRWPQHRFPFLKLPGEIRNQIYELTLLPLDHIRLRRITRKDKTKFYIGFYTTVFGPARGPVELLTREDWPSAALLRTCCQINSEATPLLYHGYFEFMSFNELSEFLGQIGPTNRRLVSEIALLWIKGDLDRGFAAEMKPELIYVQNYMMFNKSGRDIAVEVLFHQLRPWIEKVGDEEDDPVAAMSYFRRHKPIRGLFPYNLPWDPIPPFFLRLLDDMKKCVRERQWVREMSIGEVCDA